ncbi:MAG: group III truncated hemoglobin [Bacteroidota bacterium]
MKELHSREDIDILVASFYDKALHDPLIGHFFTKVVALDLAGHLPVICDFWESILLGNAVYRGNPMLKHLDLARKSPLNAEHMNRWLLLWEQSLAEHFQGEKADLALERAQSIGRLMLFKMEGLKE